MMFKDYTPLLEENAIASEIIQCDQTIEKKIRPILRKSSQKYCQAKKFKNIYIKSISNFKISTSNIFLNLEISTSKGVLK